MQIIPAIDVIDGKCVRLTQGDFTQKKIYYDNPLDIAKQFEYAGINRLHLVDLEGSKKGKIMNLKVLEKIAKGTKLIIDFGGGINSDEAIDMAFKSGAEFASIGSLAVKNENLFNSWIERFGAEKFLLAADVNNEKLAISGWLEKTDILVFDFISKYINKGIENIFCTDIAKDGLLKGPSIDLYQKILAHFPELNLIASGGVNSINDLEKLAEIGCSGVIIGKAIYENRITLKQLSSFINNAD